MRIVKKFKFMAGKPTLPTKDPEVDIRHRYLSGTSYNFVTVTAATEQIKNSKIDRIKSEHEQRIIYAKSRTLKYLKRDLNVKKYSLAQLRKMGHPYSRRRPNLSVVGGKPYVMNIQTGRLRSLFRVRTRYNKQSEKLFVYIDNKAPHARFIFFSRYGTRQVDRPVFFKAVEHFSKIFRRGK